MEIKKQEFSIGSFIEEAFGIGPKTKPVISAPPAASAPTKDPAEVLREKNFKFYYNQAYSGTKAIGQIHDVSDPLQADEIDRRLGMFQWHLSEMEKYGKDEKQIGEEKAYLYRRLYTECLREVEARIKRGDFNGFTISELYSDPHFMIASSVGSKGHFKSETRWRDDLDGLLFKFNQSAQDYFSKNSSLLLGKGLSEAWRGDFGGAWNHLDTGVRFFAKSL